MTFVEHSGFMNILKIGVLFLQFLSLPTRTSILKPHRNLSRVQTKLQCELVLPFRLKFMFIAEISLKKTNLLYGELSLLGDDGAIFSSSILSISLVPWLIIFPYSIDMNKLIEIKLRRVFNFMSKIQMNRINIYPKKC